MASLTPVVLRHFAQVLRAARRARKLSIEDLARGSNLPRSMVVAMEAGRRSPTLAQLVVLAQALGCGADELVAATLARGTRHARRQGGGDH